jgi:hypothetical protein
MTTVNAINPNIDLTVRVFDSFYNFDISVPAEEYDVVFSFFKSVFTDAVAAKNFTTTLFRVARETDTPVVTLLAEMQNQDQITVTAQLAYYLNGLRSPATLIGINAVATPNFYTARNVLP